MDTQNISRRGVKRRRANSLPNQNQRSPADQINGTAQQSISRLPIMVMDSATMYYTRDSGEGLKELSIDKFTIVSFDDVLQKKQSTRWFHSRGLFLDAPADIPAENAIIGARKWTRRYDSNVNMCIHGPAPEKIPLSWKEQDFPWFQKPRDEGADSEAMEFRKPVLYFAQLNPLLNQCSWDYLAQFLKLIYQPTTFIKEVKMFAVNQNFIDSLKCNVDSVSNEPCYICCESFSFASAYIINPYPGVIPDSLKWLPRNVRAEKIELPWILQTSETLDLVANFLLDPSGAKQCATKQIKISVTGRMAFLDILIQKFHSIPLIENGIPTIEFMLSRRDGLPVHLGPNLIAQEGDSDGGDARYRISNGPNRMQVSIGRKDTYFNTSDCKVRIYRI